MSLSINTYPATMALAGNPVKLSINSTSFVTYTISVANGEVYTGSGEGSFSVFVQDILSGIVSAEQLYNEDTKVIISLNKNIQNVTIQAINKEGENASIAFTAVAGGISKRLLRRLNDENSNIFTYKLLNAAGNFFHTTRSTSRVFSLRETELAPIPFLYPDTPLRVVADGISTELAGNTGKAYALNLWRLRRNLYDEHGILPSVFDICSGDTKACTIIITPGTVSKERYLLEFLNSYSAYERIEVTGDGTFEQPNTEDTTYHQYDESVDDYIECRERQSRKDVLKVDSGYKNADDIIFMLDMLSSDDVKILGLSGQSIKVIPEAENLTRAARATVPESIKLTLRFADSESYQSGSLNEEDFGSPRIHTEQFSKEFN